jgi:iron complex transport system ATP-binding protein
MGLQSFGDRRADRLSTGERSRALIARALVAQAKLLLLDEPTANLDPLWQLRLMERLRTLSRSGEQVVLVALHDLELARLHADRLIVMDCGRIAADGGPELLDGPVMREVFGIERQSGRWMPADQAG